MANVSALIHTGKGHRVHDLRMKSCSLLPMSFNALWCEALNERDRGITHFAMMHDDLCVEDGWLETLLAEMEAHGADVVSAVIPLKDDRGLTSTGVFDAGNRMRKLSLAEALALPRTFSAADAGYPGCCLLLNTGLWVCRFTEPWVEQVVFRLHDTIIQDSEGKFRPACVSEDWLFSVDCARLGLKTMATTAVKLKHQGVFDYPNFVAWGSRADEGEWATAWNVDPPAKWRESVKARPTQGGPATTQQRRSA